MGFPGDTALLLLAFLGGFLGCTALRLLWQRIARSKLVHMKYSASDAIILKGAIVSCCASFMAPLMAVYALLGLPLDDDSIILVVAPTKTALCAVGISCGYMLYDALYSIAHPSMRSPLIIMHHLLSVAFFPYATCSHRCVLLVLFFVATEITNIGQHLRIILQKLGFEKSRSYMINGVSWAVGFVLIRILPAPFFMYKILSGSYAQFSTFDFLLASLLMPIPFMLNAFWFYMIVLGVFKAVGKGKKPAARPASVAQKQS